MLLHEFTQSLKCRVRNRNTSFFASVDASTLAQYIFHVYLVANQKRELGFKMVVTVGLQDISSMCITLETSHGLIFYVNYLRIKLIG